MTYKHKEDQAKYMREWQKRNPKKIKEANEKYRKKKNLVKNNKRKIKIPKNKYNETWRKGNPEYHKNYMKDWLKRNPDYFKNWAKNNPNYFKKLYTNHPEKYLEYNKRHLEKLGKTFDMTSMEYNYASINWSKTIKKLDNYMCKNCDSKENLHAHHIQPKSIFPESSLDLDNGITLCNNCHSNVHGFNIL